MFEFLLFILVLAVGGFLILSSSSSKPKHGRSHLRSSDSFSPPITLETPAPPPKPDIPVPYRSRNRLMSQAEGSFFQVLELALPKDQYRLFGKVRVEDLIVVKNGLTRDMRQSARNRIRSRHVDIVVVDSKTFVPVWAIELDDKSHQAKDRQERDEFLDRAFEAAGLPLIRFPAKRGYTRESILSALGLSNASDEVPETSDSEPSNTVSGVTAAPQIAADHASEGCSKCAAPMKIRRMNGAGGRVVKVQVCSRYPECSHMVPLKVS